MDETTYASPFSWRYGRAELRELFSERERRRLWRSVWVALARSQSASGLVSAAEVADLEAHAGDIDLPAALAIEREIGHDLMAEIRVFASQAKVGGGKIHLGATSMDIEDTVETYRMRRALAYLGEGLHALLGAFAARVEQYAALVCMGYTHLQPAEPTTVGYRLATYAQDLLIDDTQLRGAYEALTAKGIRGAVGTSASYERLLRGTGRRARDQEDDVLAHFDLTARDVATQTYPRKLDYLVLSSLAGLGASLSKFAADMRVLSSPGFGELFEPFGAKQVGSSAMPFKRNPIMSERIGSLARLLVGYADTAWQNAATNYLERTLDDSANRRTILPEAFLCADELLGLALKIVTGLRVDERRITINLRTYGPFAGSEAVLMEAVKAGGDRQVLHESIRDASMRAYDRLAAGGDNPLAELLVDDERLTSLLDPAEIRLLLDPTDHIGDAPERAHALADRVKTLPPFPVPRTPRRKHTVNKGLEVTRGKTKALYEKPGQPDVLIVSALDNITAGDGARRDEIAGKGRIAAKTTARVFRLLNLCGLPTHYLSGGEDDDDNEMLVRRCSMVPLEVVVRGVAAGSLVRRKPGIARGSILVPRMVEFFVKDDANHDPLIEPDDIVHQGLASAQEIGAMSEIARITFEILAHAWRRRETLLVDLKVEFGRIQSGEGRGNLVIADVIDNDSWRIWPQGREDLMLDKQAYRNLDSVTPADLERVRDNYERVGEMVGTFPMLRPGMVALVADGADSLPIVEDASRAMQTFGLQALRRVVSTHLVPGYVLQAVQQLDASFSRIVYVASGPQLAAMLAAATPTPVFDATEYDADELGLVVAKTLALDDTVMFGRVLLVQANARSAVLQADAQINAPPQQAQIG